MMTSVFPALVFVFLAVGIFQKNYSTHGARIQRDSYIGRIQSVDFRTISHEDLLRDLNTIRFSNAELDSFSHFVIDKGRRQIIAGARDHVIRLRLDDLTLLEKVTWSPDPHNITTCVAKGQTNSDCHNYIRVLILNENSCFVCGTNAFAPLCSWRRVDSSLEVVESWISGVGKCPYSPHQNNTFLMASDGNYYSATVTDFTARDAAIYRTMGPSKYLRTVRFNSHWLNEPDFVSSYEIGDYIYFFFREAAIEYINCGKNVYSRVARICKSDSGGKILLEDNWTSFLKARLNCSLPGSYPFYFNDLQSTFFDEGQQLIYAVFTTPPTSIYASAVCVFNVSTMDQAFRGPYKHQSDAQMAWTRVPNPAPNAQCPSSGAAASASVSMTPEADPSTAQRPLLDIQQHQMMDSAIQSIGLNPLVVMETERLIHVTLDRVKVKVKSVFVQLPVLFLATLEGVIHKMAILPNSKTACLVEKIHLTPDHSRPGSIYSMKLDSEQRFLYISTQTSFYRISVERCHRFQSKIQCLAAQDPYCGWDETAERCAPQGHPNLSSCPTYNFSVDGGWSSWSPWQPCAQSGVTSSSDNSDQCLCRIRSCDQPQRSSEGRNCEDQALEITNCTAHPHLPIHGVWSSWTEWTECSAICGVGFQMRMRTCDRQSPRPSGKTCNGNSQEWRICNKGECDEVQKVSEWSPWLRANTSKNGGYHEKRFRCICKGVVTDPLQLKAPVLKTSMRYCTPVGDVCDTGTYEIPDVDGQWSEWSTWTLCSALCGSGTQHRERLCSAPSPRGAGRDCRGASRELRACNRHSCSAHWMCWSDFSPCSVSCGHGGTRRRHRVCELEMTPERHFAQPCEGDDTEVMTCERSPCKGGSSGWSLWSEWSVCDSDDHQQSRKRQCDGSTTILCFGASTERRKCTMVKPVHDPLVVGGRDLYPYNLITVSVLAFLVGFAVGALSLVLVLRHRNRKYKDIDGSSFVRAPIKSNEYSSCYDDHIAFPPIVSDEDKANSPFPVISRSPTPLKVKDSTLKRGGVVERSDSLMRTKLDLPDAF